MEFKVQAYIGIALGTPWDGVGGKDIAEGVFGLLPKISEYLFLSYLVNKVVINQVCKSDGLKFTFQSSFITFFVSEVEYLWKLLESFVIILLWNHPFQLSFAQIFIGFWSFSYRFLVVPNIQMLIDFVINIYNILFHCSICIFYFACWRFF